ncbi:hypothetical protein M6B38_147425 [Iris pallida]|uniref:Uncharacterized protein n=1 Tax=Iris pallida TaxID=29817 RepID=A0AAX6F9X4_IRIPA|nr:hypothetical protein M6B38_147425 [Iris pallida]
MPLSPSTSRLLPRHTSRIPIRLTLSRSPSRRGPASSRSTPLAADPVAKTSRNSRRHVKYGTEAPSTLSSFLVRCRACETSAVVNPHRAGLSGRVRRAPLAGSAADVPQTCASAPLLVGAPPSGEPCSADRLRRACPSAGLLLSAGLNRGRSPSFLATTLHAVFAHRRSRPLLHRSISPTLSFSPLWLFHDRTSKLSAASSSEG